MKVGDWFNIISDNENYDNSRNRPWQVNHVARSTKDHPGYDSGVGGPLYDAEGLNFSLYEYEVEQVAAPRQTNSRTNPNTLAYSRKLYKQLTPLEFKVRGYRYPIRLLRAHAGDWPKIVRMMYPKYSKLQHTQASEYHRGRVSQLYNDWSNLVSREFKKKFGREYHMTDYKVAGIAREEFPEKVKDRLRELNRLTNFHSTMAIGHWHASGKRKGMPAISTEPPSKQFTQRTAKATNEFQRYKEKYGFDLKSLITPDRYGNTKERGYVLNGIYHNFDERIRIGGQIDMTMAGLPNDFPKPWKLIKAENYYSSVSHGNRVKITIQASNGRTHEFDDVRIYSPHAVKKNGSWRGFKVGDGIKYRGRDGLMTIDEVYDIYGEFLETKTGVVFKGKERSLIKLYTKSNQRSIVLSENTPAKELEARYAGVTPDNMNSKIHDEWKKVTKIHQTGGFAITIKATNYPIWVPKENRFIFRTVYPRESFGAWAVWGFKYKGKSYSSMADDIWGYLTLPDEPNKRQ